MPKETWDKLNKIESTLDVREALEGLLELPGCVQFENYNLTKGQNYEFSSYDIEKIFEGNSECLHLPRFHESIFRKVQAKTPMVIDVRDDTYIVTYSRNVDSSLGPCIKLQKANRI